MRQLTIRTAAKINLALDITGKRPDGYHTLETIFQTVSIYDTLQVQLVPKPGIQLQCNLRAIPCNEKNLVYQAAALFLEKTGLQSGVSIFLRKFIPSQAGMGGGSSDAAATLYALNRLTHAGIPLETLCEWGLQLGADVPFFFYGGTAFADGIGERLKALPAQAGTLLLLAKGRIGVSTKTAYQKLDGCSNLQHPNVQELKHCILQGKLLVQLAPLCSNLFEQGISNAEISSIQQTMRELGAACSVMTGSGAAVFGMFESTSAQLTCYQRLQKMVPFVMCCKTTDTSFQIVSEQS